MFFLVVVVLKIWVKNLNGLVWKNIKSIMFEIKILNIID